MYALVYWLDEKLYSVVDLDDVVLGQNSTLEEGILCEVKWREKRGRRVEETLFQAEIKSFSENNEELELRCAALAEQMAVMSARVHGKRKRKRTEKAQNLEAEETETIIPAKTSEKKATEKDISTKENETDKPGREASQKKSQKAEEQKLVRNKKNAEIAARKALANQFFDQTASTNNSHQTPAPDIQDNLHRQQQTAHQQNNEQQNFIQLTPPPNNQLTPPPSNQLTPPPSNQLTLPPNNQLTPPPSNQLTPPPSNQLTPPPNNQRQPLPHHLTTTANTRQTLPTNSHLTPLSNSHLSPNNQQTQLITPDVQGNYDERQNNVFYGNGGLSFGELLHSSLTLTLTNGEIEASDNAEFEYPDDSAPIASEAANHPKCANCERLEKEIEKLKKNKIPEISPQVRDFLQKLLNVDIQNEFENADSYLVSQPIKTSRHYSAAPGRQELYEGAGIYLSSVELNSIHMDAGKRPSEILNKLLDHFFDVETLAGPPDGLDKNIVHACTVYAKRCATVWKVEEKTDFAKTVRNKRGSAKRKYKRLLKAV